MAAIILDELCSSLCVRQLSSRAPSHRTVIDSSAALLRRRGQRLRRGQEDLTPAPSDVRFHLVPPCGWDEPIQNMRCAARNALKKKGEEWIPDAPGMCWLLPASDEVAVVIAQRQAQLRALGWKLLTSEAHVVLRLGNKALLRDHAERFGLLAHLPCHYDTPEAAEYPCMLKSATGEFGKENHIVACVNDVYKVVSAGIGSQWILQEIVAHSVEYSVSLLVKDGRILDSIGTAYEANRDVYIWPHVRGVRMTPYDASETELAVMEEFLVDYTGICNFNYKIRCCGRMAIFEVNTRVGGDLACDVPRERAGELFEKLDALVDLGAQSPVCESVENAVCVPRDANTTWEDPLVIDPSGGVHRYTLVYLHPFKIGLRDYLRKMGLFNMEGLRIVMPNAQKLAITCFDGKPMKAWYDYLEDNRGDAEDDLDEASLACTRQYISGLLDEERARIRETVEGYQGDGGDRVLIGGCSQGCGTALDVALCYPVRLMGFIGIVGHPLSVTPLGNHLATPLHFFVGANDKVMRWRWVKDLVDGLRQAGYEQVVVHGPLHAVHHGVTREFEAKCIREAFDQCVNGCT